ncbi:MAG TPA: hypothetical protein VKZ95_03595 [Sphingobacteriaceae bacterium]|nr:hypothetical protein [Sphingobacteriaceae bacterium]
MYRKGDILWVAKELRNPDQLKHAAVIWQDEYLGTEDFHGIMLTTAGPEKGYDNIAMSSEHFEDNHQFKWKNSHFVNQLFVKCRTWGEFFHVGRLTVDGISFIEDNLTNLDPMEFRHYREM